MSQQVSIRRVKHTGAPVYLGHDDATDTELFTSNPQTIIEWMCDAYRFRFNQHRALRKKGVWAEDPDNPGHRIPLRDADGQKVLAPIGEENPVEVSDKEARRLFPHLAALPMQVLQHPARVENTEWWAATKRRRTCRQKGVPAGAMPRFRSAKRGDKRFGIWFNGGRNATVHKTGRRTAVLVIKGQNPPGHRQPGSPRWRVTIAVRLSEDIRPYTSVEVNWAAKRVTFISPPPDRTDAPTGAVVGVDRGVVHAVATSDGDVHDLVTPSETERLRTYHQRAMARSKTTAEAEGRDWRGSKRRKERRRLAAKHAAKVARTRKDFADQVSHRLVRDYDAIAFEDLNVTAMTKSAQGTVEEPGSNVAQKRGLNRAILGMGWSDLLEKTTSKAGRAGKTVVLVNPAYTSQECAECGHTAASNRESQAVFACRECGHTDNADVNAARNVLARGLAFMGRAGPAGRECQTGAGEARPAVPREPRTPALALTG